MKVCLYCTCMGQLTKILPEAALREALGPDIRLVTTDRLCQQEACEKAVASIQDARPLVAAACSAGARGKEALAGLRTCADQMNSASQASGRRGLNEAKTGLVESGIGLADIREACIWPGMGSDSQKVAEQAADLVRMRMVALNQGLASVSASATPKDSPRTVLVVGGGPAGLAATSTLAGLGIAVTLAERRPKTGGLLNQLGALFPALSRPEELVATLPLHGATVRTGVAVSALRKEDGIYVASLSSGQEVEEQGFAAVILATGGQPVLPGKRFRAGELRGVISQMELENQLGAVEKGVKDRESLPLHAVFIQCVNAREEAAPYCSAVCCPTAVKNALRLKKLRPEADVTILHRQMVMPGIALEELYRQAMLAGVRFRHVEDMNTLRVEGSESIEAVCVPDATGATGATGEADGNAERLVADRLVCSTPIKPSPGTEALLAGLGLRFDAMRFVCGQEPAHPLESGVDGIFLCGSVRWPVYVGQAAEQGRAAALLAARTLHDGRMPLDEVPEQGAAARVRLERCSGCGRCVDACPHAACSLGAPGGKSAVNADACRRCGVCAAVCPCAAAYLPLASPCTAEVLAALGPDVYCRAAVNEQRRLA